MRSVWFDRIEDLVEQVNSSSLKVWDRNQIERLFGLEKSAAGKITHALAEGGETKKRRNDPNTVTQDRLREFLSEFRKILSVSADGLAPKQLAKKKADTIDQAQKRLKQILDSGILRPLTQIGSHLETLEIGAQTWAELEQQGQTIGLSPCEVAEDVLDDWARRFAARAKRERRALRTAPKAQPAPNRAENISQQSALGSLFNHADI